MYRVLLVDDEIWSLKGLESSFEWEEEGFSVMERTTSSTEAMKFIEAERPDAVFTDIRMPGRSGLHLLEDVKNRFPDIPQRKLRLLFLRNHRLFLSNRF